MLADAWNTLTPINLRNAWNKLVGRAEENSGSDVNVEENFNEIVDLFPKIPGFSDCDADDAQDWLDNDSDPGFHVMDDDEIVAFVEQDDEDVEEAESKTSTDDNGPGHGQAFTAAETLLGWYKKQPESDPTQLLLLLKRIRDLAAHKRITDCVQKKT